MRLNIPIILNILGLLLLISSGFMVLCIPVSLYYGEGDLIPLLASAGITLVAGLILQLSTRSVSNKELRKRDGYMVVTMGWVVMSLFGCLPYVLSGSIPSFTDAYFETLSGFSTTGATILTEIESVNKGILFWRSLTQWIGGMGIIVLAVAVLPLLGIGGMQLFMAEAPGISPEKLKPRIKETAKRLWIIYVGLTFLEMGLLYLGGMSLYDAANHSLTTMATGGFSTKNASIAFFDQPFIQYVIIVFMMLAGTNFTLTYFLLKFNIRRIWSNEEFRTYLMVLGIFSAIVGCTIYFVTSFELEPSFRQGLFQVVSIVTTTGYITADYTTWTAFGTVIFFILMFIGGSAGSTAGGVKIIRHLILFKNSFLELKRQIHPSAVIPVRLNNKSVSQEITFNILAFIMIYLSVFAFGSILLSLTGADYVTAIGAVATCLGNIGPGLGDVGPVDNFAGIHWLGKWLLALLMLMGRLELFTVLMLFTPYYWRTH